MKSFFDNKNVLVTGATGFIGTNLVEKLVSLGINVTATTFNKQPQKKNSNVKYIKTDLTQKLDCVKACKGMDYVFMCAANSSGAGVIASEPLTHLTPNLVMNAQMLAASYSQGVKKFAFISSNTIYPVTDFSVSEEDVTYDFFDKYYIVGWMKLFSEKMCNMYSNKIPMPMNTISIRPGNLYGPFDKYTKRESKVIAALIRRFSEGQNPLEVWGDGKDIKDFLYIDDFIDGLLKAFCKNKLSGPINIASGKAVTIKDVIENLKSISCRSETIVEFDINKPTMIPKRMISIELAKKELNWKPKYSLYDGLKKTFEWYNSYYKNFTPEEQK